jgi:hypothetical protein
MRVGPVLETEPVMRAAVEALREQHARDDVGPQEADQLIAEHLGTLVRENVIEDGPLADAIRSTWKGASQWT